MHKIYENIARKRLSLRGMQGILYHVMVLSITLTPEPNTNRTQLSKVNHRIAIDCFQPYNL